MFYNLILGENMDLNTALEDFNMKLFASNDFEECFKIGNSLYDFGKFEKAKVAYKLSIGLNPNNARAYNNLGVTLIDLNEINEATEVFKKVIELDPIFFKKTNCININFLLRELDKFNKTVETYKEAIELDSSSMVNSYLNFSILLSNFNSLNEIVKIYKREIGIQF